MPTLLHVDYNVTFRLSVGFFPISFLTFPVSFHRILVFLILFVCFIRSHIVFNFLESTEKILFKNFVLFPDIIFLLINFLYMNFPTDIIWDPKVAPY